MIPVTYKMIDLNGLDLAEVDGSVVPGIYNKITFAYNTSRFAVMCNWFFAGIIISPAHVLISQVENGFLINDLILVKSDDTVKVLGLYPEAVIEELEVTENGTYTAPAGVDGYSPVVVNVPGSQPPVLVSLNATENGDYLPAFGEDGFSEVHVSVPVPLPYDGTPEENGTGTPGVSEKWARGDHIHPKDTSKADQAQLATVESSSIASRAYAVGEYLCYNGILYRVTTAIASGGTITPNTNCTATSVGADIARMLTEYSFSGTTSLPTSNDVPLEPSKKYFVWIQRLTGQVYLGGAIVQANGTVNLMDISGNRTGSYFDVTTGTNKLIVTARYAGVGVFVLTTP